MSIPKTLRFVVAVRHGEYDAAKRLDGIGKSQMTLLAEALTPLLHEVQEEHIRIFHSPFRRAEESAQIIRTKFALSKMAEERTLLGGTFAFGVQDAKTILGKLEDDIEAVIFVTHCEAPSGIIHRFASSAGRCYPQETTEKGKGLLLNLTTREILRIP